MNLMKLAPETVRLRRVARAHSLGEFTLEEYRRARREVIDNFDTQRDDGDDTRPRVTGLAGNASIRVIEGEEPRSRRSWMRWLLAALALLVATQLFAAASVASVETIEIPVVAERDPNPATSPRLSVSSVMIEMRDWSLAVDAEELNRVIDARLEQIRLRNQPGNHGFNPMELAEVGRLLNALGAHDPEVALSDEDAADLSALLRDQKLRRGISVVELEEVAAAVQARLRDAGYFLAVAYLPAQTVAERTVRIGVLPGVIGEVRVAGGDDRLAGRFDDLLGRPVTSQEINTRLYALNQAPGFNARASFEPGVGTGESRLSLEVVERSRLRGDVALDNYGDRHTGRQRLVLSGDLINPAGRGDVLRLGLAASIDPSNQLLGFAEYVTPVGNRRQLRGRLARNEFNTGGSDNIDADGWLFDGVLETFLHQDRLTGISYELGIGRHDLEWQTAQGPIAQQVSMLSSALNARRVWDDVRIAAGLRVYADVGSIGGDTFVGQEERFWDLGFNLFGWHPFDLPMLPGRQKVSVQLRAQLSDMQLPSTRRMALGGVDGARGFERDLFLADSGVMLRTDLRTPLSLGELSLFLDAAYGKNRNELLTGWAHVANLGVAWNVRFGKQLLSSLSWAVPVTANGTGGLEDDGSKLYWSLRYAY